MYTFQPLADIPVDHTGFGIIFAFCIIWLILVLMNEPESFFMYFFLTCFPVGIAYGVSYHWTNQEPKTFVNEKVTGEFIEFVAEGYNIPVQSGKTTRHVDQHEQYVVYKVNGQRIMMRAKLGMTYPERVTLYKN